MSQFRAMDLGGGGSGRDYDPIQMGGRRELEDAMAMPTSQRARQGQAVQPQQQAGGLDPNEMREYQRRRMAERRAMETQIRQRRAAAQRGSSRPVSDALIPGLAELQAQEAEIRQEVANNARLMRRAEGREMTPEQVEASRQRLAGQIPGAMAGIAQQQQAELSGIQERQMAQEVAGGRRMAGDGLSDSEAAMTAMDADPRQRRDAGLYDFGDARERAVREEMAGMPTPEQAQQRFMDSTQPDFEDMARRRAALDVTEDQAIAAQTIRQRMREADMARQRSEASAAELAAQTPERMAQMEQDAMGVQESQIGLAQEQINQELENLQTVSPQERQTKLAELQRAERDARRALERGEATAEQQDQIDSLQMQREILGLMVTNDELEKMLSGEPTGTVPPADARQAQASTFADFIGQLQEKNLGTDRAVAQQGEASYNGARAVSNVRAMADQIAEVVSESDRRAYAQTIYQTLQEQLGRDGVIILNTPRPGSIGRVGGAISGSHAQSQERYKMIAQQINRIARMAGVESPSVRVGNQFYDPTGTIRSGLAGFYEDVTD
jgi:hypothetical protein